MMTVLIVFLIVVAIIGFILGLLFFITIGIGESDVYGLYGLIVVFMSVFMFTVGMHLDTWEQRKHAFVERYDVSRVITLGDTRVKYVKKNEDICTAKVVYKPSDPQGELYIVEGSIKCENLPKILDKQPG